MNKRYFFLPELARMRDSIPLIAPLIFSGDECSWVIFTA